MFPATRCDQHPCDKLHICRGFLEESCRYGEKCKKPHSFDSCVTKTLLIQHDLNSLSPGELKKLFQNALKEHKRRHAASISSPGVCVRYRKGVVTCKEGDRCKFLHVCKKYIKGSCKSEAECGLSHNIKTRHVRRVLATHNLGDLRNEEKILAILRSNMEPEPSNKKCLQKFQASLNMKLFSHLIARGEKCRLPIADVEKFLQEFGRDEVTYSCFFSSMYLLVFQSLTFLSFCLRNKIGTYTYVLRVQTVVCLSIIYFGTKLRIKTLF